MDGKMSMALSAFTKNTRNDKTQVLLAMFKRFHSLLFCLLLTIFVACGSKNTYYQTPNNGFSRFPYWGWIKQKALLMTSTDASLETMALHSHNPVYRAMAYEKLAAKQSPKCHELLLAELKDTCSFNVQWLDLVFLTDVASFDLQVAEENPQLFTEGQRHHIDSVVVFGAGLDHLSKSPSATRLYGMEGVYDRVHDLCLNGDTHLLTVLAEYKNPQDIPLVTNALLGKMKGDNEPEAFDEQRENSENALAAITIWRDEAFIPALEELRNYQLSYGILNYTGVKTLYKVVMAYDNEWANTFIEDMFKDSGNNLDSYSEALYQAFYEGCQSSRFLPLVERYGKQPPEWDNGY